jgi:glycosyltransferase involved in cell wall biosynthesis
MKSVLVCTAQAPFVTGGAETLVRDLVANLENRGFRADVVSVPFHAYPPSELLRQALVWRLLELRETSGRRPDLVIATKFPSYLASHPCKVTWLVHQYREAYDLMGTELSPLADGPRDRELLSAIRSLDGVGLGECRRIFAISRNVAARLGRWNALHATALYPPPPQVGRYLSEAYGDYLLHAGRLEKVKRPELAIRALAASRSAAKLKVAGRGPLEADLRRLAAASGVGDRVEFLGFVSDRDLLRLYAGCRGTIYAPRDEDYGYVPVESLLSRKPVITVTDAGGPLEFVEDEVTGLVRAPEPGPLADAIDRLFEAPASRLCEMGNAGHARVAGIGWDAVVEQLTEPVR